jgi:hypothetical protein
MTVRRAFMKLDRTPMQLCEELAALLSAAPRLPALFVELANNPNVREDIIRERLAAHGIEADRIEGVVSLYRLAKARRG